MDGLDEIVQVLLGAKLVVDLVDVLLPVAMIGGKVVCVLGQLCSVGTDPDLKLSVILAPSDGPKGKALTPPNPMFWM